MVCLCPKGADYLLSPYILFNEIFCLLVELVPCLCLNLDRLNL